MVLKKEEEPTTKILDDDEWIGSLSEAETVTVDIPEGQVSPGHVSRWLLALSEGEIAALMVAMKQVGVGSPKGGAGALAIFPRKCGRLVEYSLVLRMVAAETRLHIAGQQAKGIVP